MNKQAMSRAFANTTFFISFKISRTSDLTFLKSYVLISRKLELSIASEWSDELFVVEINLEIIGASFSRPAFIRKIESLHAIYAVIFR